MLSFPCVYSQTNLPTRLLIEVLCSSLWYLYYINIVSTDQELMCFIQFQSSLVLLDLHDGIF